MKIAFLSTYTENVIKIYLRLQEKITKSIDVRLSRTLEFLYYSLISERCLHFKWIFSLVLEFWSYNLCFSGSWQIFNSFQILLLQGGLKCSSLQSHVWYPHLKLSSAENLGSAEASFPFLMTRTDFLSLVIIDIMISPGWYYQTLGYII